MKPYPPSPGTVVIVRQTYHCDDVPDCGCGSNLPVEHTRTYSGKVDLVYRHGRKWWVRLFSGQRLEIDRDWTVRGANVAGSARVEVPRG